MLVEKAMPFYQKDKNELEEYFGHYFDVISMGMSGLKYRPHMEKFVEVLKKKIGPKGKEG